MRLFESIADRRITEARAAGLFDNLPGAGKPIADLHLERPPGWWASRAVKIERDKMRFDDLRKQLAILRARLWRSVDVAELQDRLDEFNRTVSEYNATTSFERLETLEPAATMDRWREINSRRR